MSEGKATNLGENEGAVQKSTGTMNISLEERVREIYTYRYKAMVSGAKYVWDIDLDCDVIIGEESQEKTFFIEDEVLNYVSLMSSLCKRIPEGYRQRVQYVFQKERLLANFYQFQSVIRYDFPISFHEGEELKWVQGSISLMLAPDACMHAVLCLHDSGARSESIEVFDPETQYDLLSGLYSGGAFREKVNDVLQNDRRTQGGYLFVIDIDCFNEMNREHGSCCGDKVICSVADVLKNCFRGDDILGRVGGDEFMAFVRNIDEEHAKKRVAEITETLTKIQDKQMRETVTTLSVGIAEANIYDGYASLAKKASKALYRAKSNGKGSWSLWS